MALDQAIDEIAAKHYRRSGVSHCDSCASITDLFAVHLDADPSAGSVRFWCGRQALDGMSVCYRDAWESAHPDEAGHTFTRRNALRKDMIGRSGGSNTSSCGAESTAGQHCQSAHANSSSPSRLTASGQATTSVCSRTSLYPSNEWPELLIGYAFAPLSDLALRRTCRRPEARTQRHRTVHVGA